MDNTDALLRAVERSEVHLHAADGIATTLYNHSPATLRAFLDLSKHDFTFQHQERVEGSSRFDLLIRREGRTLTVCSGLLTCMQRSSLKSIYRLDSTKISPKADIGTFSMSTTLKTRASGVPSLGKREELC